jgi:hypothetical protein
VTAAISAAQYRTTAKQKEERRKRSSSPSLSDSFGWNGIVLRLAKTGKFYANPVDVFPA